MYNIIKRDNNTNANEITKLAKQHNTNNKIIELLLNRGYKKSEIANFILKEYKLESFNSIKNVDKAAEQIHNAILNDYEIYIFGDYDSDGINADYIMANCITTVIEAYGSKSKVFNYMPNRHEGYGLSMAWCKKHFPRKSNKKRLVITVDNGITKKLEVEYLLSKNVEVIITDHHAPKKGYTPECLIVDPWLNDLNNKNALGLCGASVAFKVCGYLLETLVEDDSNYILNYLPNAAIATITDMMPYTPENLNLVAYGLWLIEEGFANPGILHYRKSAGKKLGIKDLAFEIGPYLNACGRMGDINKAVEFMFGDDEEYVEDIYNQMLNLNDERKLLEKTILEEIRKKEEDFANDIMIIVEVPNLGGLGGTIASKIVNLYNKPVIILTGSGDVLHGSARNIGDIDLHVLFNREVSKNNLVDFGGHKAAAGVTVKRSKLNSLRQSINDFLKEYVIVEEENEMLSEINIEVDEIINLADIKRNTILPYQDMLYFGTLSEPVFAIKDVEIIEARSSANNADHLCLNLQDISVKATPNKKKKLVGKEIWLWNKMPEYKRIGEPKKVHLLGTIIPDFRNPRLYTFDVKSIIPA